MNSINSQFKKKVWRKKSTDKLWSAINLYKLKKISHPTIKGENTQDLVVEKREQKWNIR